MSTINVTFKSIRFINTNDESSQDAYRITFQTKFDGIAKADDVYVETQVDYIDYPKGYLMYLLCDCIPDFAIVYADRQELARRGVSTPITSGFLTMLLQGAVLTIDRTKFVTDEEYTDYTGEVKTHEYYGYSKAITEIKLSDKAQVRLDAKIEEMF